ncbi:unnamed protein product [Arctogadus glacialis]
MLSVDLETLGMLSVDLDTLSMPSVDLDELSMLSVDLDELSMLSVDLDTGHAQCGPGRTEHAQFVQPPPPPSMGVLQTGQQTAPRLMPFPSGSIRFRLVPSGSDLPLSRQRLFLPDSAVARPLTLAVKTFLSPGSSPFSSLPSPGGQSRQDRLDSIAVAGAVMGAVLALFLITVFTIVIVASRKTPPPSFADKVIDLPPTHKPPPPYAERPPAIPLGVHASQVAWLVQARRAGLASPAAGSAPQLSEQQWVCHQSGTDRVFINHREHYV